MSQVSENAFKYVTRIFDGTEYKLGKISPRDRQKILNRLKEERKEKLKANLKEAGVDAAQVLTELESFDNQAWGQEKWINHVNTPAGEDDIIQASWAKHNEGEFPFFESMSNAESFDLICELAGLRRVSQEDAPANPTRGEKPPTTPTASSTDAA